ncbi:MAG: hypothetical protein ACKOPO_12325 [Novosphingobium sp.]
MMIAVCGKTHIAGAAILAFASWHCAAIAAPGEASIAKSLPVGAQVETRLDADVTGDGLADVIVVFGSGEARQLRVLAAGPRGFERIGQTAMDPSPIGSAELRVARGVLIVEDMSGGTTATASLFRWRYDPAVRKMRLIGDDVSLYSRTWAHDGLDISTNRITGQRVTTRQLLRGRNDSAGYVPSKPVRKTVSRDPVYMGSEPTPDQTLGMGN